MILPTNDGFVAMNSKRTNPYGTTTTYLSAYDVGTEMNDEDCDNIPGPSSCVEERAITWPLVKDLFIRIQERMGKMKSLSRSSVGQTLLQW